MKLSRAEKLYRIRLGITQEEVKEHNRLVRISRNNRRATIRKESIKIIKLLEDGTNE